MLLAWEELTHLPECIKASLRGEGGFDWECRRPLCCICDTTVCLCGYRGGLCVIDPSAFDLCVLPGCGIDVAVVGM